MTSRPHCLGAQGGSERAEEGTASDGDVPQPDSASETDDEVIPDDVDLSIMLKAPGTVLFPSRPASSKPPSETTATAPGHPPRPPPLGSPASPSKSLPAPAPPHYRSGANHSPGGASAAWPHPRDAASEDVPTSKGVRLKDRIKSVFARLKKKRPPREPSDGDPTLEDAAPHGHPHDAPARPPGPVADLARTFNRTASQSPPGGARAHAPHRLASKAPAAGVTEWPPDAPAAVRSWEVADVGVNAPEEGASEGGVRRAVLSHAEAMQCIAAGIPDHPITPDAAEAAAGAIRTLSRMAVEELGRAKERGSAATRQARQLLTSLEEWADRLEMCAENPGVAAGTICALCGAVIRCLS